MSAVCSTSGGSCETESSACGTESCESSSSCCKACGTSCGGDPIACATAMWGQSFFQAMRAAQVDALKAKIQKAWGAKMDKAADAVIEAMGVHWQSMLAQASAKAQLRERLAGLWQEGK